jgi:hypothetical protein
MANTNKKVADSHAAQEVVVWTLTPFGITIRLYEEHIPNQTQQSACTEAGCQ